jgi:hypothetical protein
VQDSKGVHEAPESMAAVIRGNVQRDTVPLLLALMDGKIPVTVSDTIENGHKMPTLEVALPGGSPLTLIFDPVTTLLARAKYRLSNPPGYVAVEETYSDYRDVKGLKVAFTTDVRRDGAPAVHRTLRTFEFNVPVDSALFTKPS